MSKLPPIAVPKEKLQQIRIDTLRKVQREKRTKKRIVPVALVALFCITILFSIRVSPTFAGYIAKIPGFNALVSAVRTDAGIEDIVDNQYFEEINVTESEKGLSLTLQGVIADHSGFVLFYDADALFDMSNLYLNDVQLFQGDVEIPGPRFTSHSDNQQYISSLVEYSFSEPIVYTTKEFKAVFHFEDVDKGNIEITIPFTLQNEIALEKVIAVNRIVDIDGQKFTITQIRRSPLKTAIDIELDEANTMQILAFDDIAVMTDSGERRYSIVNGIAKHGDIRDGKITLNVQSNYFHETDSLTINIGAVQAVPKGEDFIEVDFGTKEVLTKPDYFDWEISVEQQEIAVAVRKGENGRKFLRLYNAVKEDGTPLKITEMKISRDEQYEIETTKFQDYDGTAKIYFDYYFNPIGENIELDIPLQ
ncbi:hypothetical protein NCCP2222_04410 [Sporosarcina sp. NCCP-2222]|uniref:DUF4179 domain-containing protein n=1 Tax=Sporosarcina sp. NCCP-2222 TaxID=2935073 RepID=UPI002089547A|nr:DUF4179 domain-containing protein [Sporosarcina sp. NCCP-2222]GKV54494.1 hypothetical protein NCCP2222_04410 [Sporosarcina sp. NCCP-2222]